MVIIAGMLPGVECARRRRLRQGGSSGAAEAPCGTRRPSFCLYAGGHDHAHLGSSGPKERSKEMARAWTLDSNAREAKERLDQKLRSQRGSVVKRHQSMGTVRPPTTKPHATSSGTDGDSNNSATATTILCALQREVFSKNGGGAARRRFSWSWLGRRAAPAEAEGCAVCLEELRAGDVLVHLPCAHRFHWSCAVPWVQATSRCPVCRAQVHLASAN
ncbi:E3 ubiquitin-protein ligase EL5-like [Phragmites australis]|uniref:E3 ubiquitin-protein ligase EL5-like n=1 Tax=Phragmites australis TaxID=29695 RepID=UPI002D799F53|nr:E3 ubiquitin-protein ligase EL5-like [Phragmites australis]